MHEGHVDAAPGEAELGEVDVPVDEAGQQHLALLQDTHLAQPKGVSNPGHTNPWDRLKGPGT